LKPTLVLLHGANGCGAEMEPLAAALRPYAEVFAPDLPGHGGREVPERFTIEDWAHDVMRQLEERGIDLPFLLGYSLGAYLALYIARHAPERVRGVCTIAVKHVFDAASIERWMHLARPETIRTKPWRIAELERYHPGRDWTQVTDRTSRLFRELGVRAPLAPDDFKAIRVPVLLISADRDQIVPWEETMALARVIPGCRVAMFYGVAHPLRMLPFFGLARTIPPWMSEVASA
jgi:pimeloyl-ACP methyl ester carboxylesterase